LSNKLKLQLRCWFGVKSYWYFR